MLVLGIWVFFAPASFADFVAFLQQAPASRRGSVPEEVAEAGFEVEALVGIEGLGWVLAHLDHWLEDSGRRSRLLEAIRRVEKEPSLLGASAHIFVVGRRS